MEVAHLRIGLVLVIVVVRGLVDLDRAVVAALVSQGKRVAGMDEQHQADDHAEETFDLAHA